MESSRKRVSIAGVVNGSPPPAHKKMKLEVDEPPQANPDSIEGVRQRNRALELDMREKNRRISFLLHKCEALYRQRVLANASLQGVRRQWAHALDEIRECSRTLTSSNQSDEELGEALRAFDSLAAIKVDSKSLELHLPEWFVSIGIEKTEEASLPASDSNAGDADAQIVKSEQLVSLDREMTSQIEERRQETVALLRNLVAALASAGRSDTALQFAHVAQEKRDAFEEVMRVKDQLLTCQQRLADMQRDLEYKETERHRVCRDFDRLQRHIEEHGSASNGNHAPGSDESSKKTDDSIIKSETHAASEREQAVREKSLQNDIAILTSKLYQERAKIETIRRDLERYKVMEQAWKQEESSLKLEYENKITQLQDENEHNAEQFEEAKLKAKEIEDHMGEQWKQTIAKVQADASKSKAQLDEVNIKNMKLREKLANASAFRDQLNELKPELDAVKKENKRLKELLKQSKVREGNVEQAIESSKVRELTEKITALETVKAELQKSIDALQAANSGEEKIAAYASRLSDVEAKYLEEISRHEATQSELEKGRIALEEMTATADASRDENDALVAEIETLNHSIKELGHTRKKLMQQVDEKRNLCKKLHSQVQHEEQAKTHYFDEITAVRLQVSSLGSLQAQQKTLIEAIKESLRIKEKELEALKEHVKEIEAERETAEADKRKAVRDAEVAKQVYATETNQKQQEKRRPCDQCDALRKKLEDTEKKLRIAALSSTNSSGGSSMTELDRLELQDLQKVVKCSVCQDRKKSVIISKCFHMFCKECVDNNLKSRNRKCPTCKKMFGQDDVKAVWLT